MLTSSGYNISPKKGFGRFKRELGKNNRIRSENSGIERNTKEI